MYRSRIHLDPAGLADDDVTHEDLAKLPVPAGSTRPCHAAQRAVRRQEAESEAHLGLDARAPGAGGHSGECGTLAEAHGSGCPFTRSTNLPSADGRLILDPPRPRLAGGLVFRWRR